MHLRVSSVTRNGKTYAYAQLVESFRRDDGVPAHRVVANLGALAPEQIANLKLALAAGRQGQRIAIDDAPQKPPRSPLANLRYLDLAVLLELAREWRLDELLGSLLPKGEATVRLSDVVLALVLQRCVDPGSKLYAERWFPRTALPELLGIQPETFNNTRIHRVLDELDAITPALMARLPSMYLTQSKQPTFGVLYVDLSDAFFVGHGPDLAVRAKTKEGFVARKIGILLLCDAQGYPLRWSVVEGNCSDCTAMTELYKQIARTPWAQQTPIVCDRAMGHTALVRTMAATGLHFLTALTRTEFDSYAPNLPLEFFSDLEACEPTEQARAQAVVQATQRARDAGLTPVSDTLWVTDCGVVEFGARVAASVEIEEDQGISERSSSAHAIRLAREVQQAVDEGRFATFAAASRSLGVTPDMTKKYRRLLGLPSDVQDAILNGDADRCSLGELLRLLKHASPDAQRDAFQDLIRTSSTRSPTVSVTPTISESASTPLRVRVVAYFNPDLFVEQRLSDARKRAAIDTFIQELNARLARRTRLDEAAVRSAIDRRLRADELLDAYDVRIDNVLRDGGAPLHVTLKPIAAAWNRRRRHHGFSVLVGHPDLSHSAQQLCQLYREKDRVEKGFQTIKSVVELRPIRHRNDAKVRAHVTLCMLALLLERRLEQKLGRSCSAPRALEELATCHLNRYQGTRGRSLYSLTQLTTEQRALLRKLRLPALADRGHISAALTPRFVSTEMTDSP